MGRKSSKETEGDPVQTILFDPLQGEIDVASGHRRWVHDTIENRLKKALTTGVIDLSSPQRMSLVHGHRALNLHVLPTELCGSVSRLAWAKHHLTKLYMTNNCLSLLPLEILQFTQLTVLGLGGNALASLPSDLGALVRLKELYIENNQLMSLPDSLAACTSLEHLSLGGNAFSLFPLVVTKCTKLVHLDLSRNELTSVPVQIRSLKRLVELNLDHNLIGPSLPDEFSSLRRLERLGLAGNCLDGMPSCLDRLDLTCLRLSGNRAPGYIVRDPLTGDVVEGCNTPVRFDGYFQLREVVRTDNATSTTKDLDGLFPVSLINLENALFDLDNENNVGRDILRRELMNEYTREIVDVLDKTARHVVTKPLEETIAGAVSLFPKKFRRKQPIDNGISTQVGSSIFALDFLKDGTEVLCFRGDSAKIHAAEPTGVIQLGNALVRFDNLDEEFQRIVRLSDDYTLHHDVEDLTDVISK
ncbi:unnamed protein product [Aphanomyces euteiches]